MCQPQARATRLLLRTAIGLCCPVAFGTALEVLHLVLHYTAANLVQLDRLEQRLEVAFAEALIALALNDLEEDRANLVFGEDLQQQIFRRAVDQDLALAQLVERLAGVGD